MPASFTKIQIISSAISKNGKDPITSIADAGSLGRTAENSYNLLYPLLLSSNRWRFAAKSLSLSRLLVDSDICEFQYIFQLPSDYLSTIKGDNGTLDFEIYGNKLYANTIEFRLEYIRDIAPENAPIWFINYVIYTIAEDIGLSANVSENFVKVNSDLKVKMMNMANFIDAQNRPNTLFKNNPIFNSRFNGT